jgi:hypothetical protein
MSLELIQGAMKAFKKIGVVNVGKCADVELGAGIVVMAGAIINFRSS